MAAPEPGLVVYLSNEDPLTCPAPDDAPDASTVEACVHYRAADTRAPTYVTIYSVSDIKAIPSGDSTGDRKRVFRQLHDAAEGEPVPPNIKGGVILSMGATHPSRETIEEWHVSVFPQIRVIPGWVRSRGYELVQGVDTVPEVLALHEYENEQSFATDEFERYVADYRRIDIIRACTQNERRILLLHKTVV
ncbi:hypothetical protein EXIGLDRAFT_782631 [Exidia glandulosa HHB12029]|uniref:EthD domain-containing protein n=1 Tax=Exidia glandulosa HHB12029 TaxID=1314781 RepID=A0A166NJT3_EXIGL|nr:hypothetical protein EXIGLDRAFT_782631 [Exidia glandulosa HHB12029]